VNHAGKEVTPLENVALFEELVDLDEFGHAHAEEGRLHFHAAIERKVVTVHHDGGASVLVKLGEPADVVDVRVGADDGFDLKFVATEETEDALNFIAGINDDGFERARVANDGAVALQHTNGELEVNHLRVSGVRQAMRWVNMVHGESISSAI
jgi:hypothetical protein